MHDEGDPFAHIQGLEQGVEVSAMVDEAIRARAAVRQLVGVAHADEVGRDAAASWLQVWQHITPEIRRGRIAVQQHDGVALSHLDVRHLAAEDPSPLLLIRKCRRDNRLQLCVPHDAFLLSKIFCFAGNCVTHASCLCNRNTKLSASFFMEGCRAKFFVCSRIDLRRRNKFQFSG
jgi:hypothetical protein